MSRTTAPTPEDAGANTPADLPFLLHLPLFTIRLAALLVLVALGLAMIVCGYPLLPLRARNTIGVAWSRTLLRICGIRLSKRGAAPLAGAGLWVSNHVSWLDIYVLNSFRHTAFVAKSDLRRWPVLGWLIAGAGTVFIDRTQRHGVRQASTVMQTRFTRGEILGLFPEGTTSSGFELRPFYASLLEPALRAAVPVQPVALIFLHHGRRSSLASYAGDDTLIANLWRVLGATDLVIEAIFLEPLATTEPGLTRHALSQQVHADLTRVIVHEQE